MSSTSVPGTGWHGPVAKPISIFVNNMTPDNIAPVIAVDSDGKTDWVDVSVTDIVAPFRYLSFSDAEDGSTTPPTNMTVSIKLLNPSLGVYILPDKSKFPGLVLSHDPADGSGLLAVTGS